MRRSARSSRTVRVRVASPHAHRGDDAITPAGLVCGGPAGAARVLPVGARVAAARCDSPTSFGGYVTLPDAGRRPAC